MSIISKEEALKKLQRYCAYQDRCHQEVRTKLLDLGMRFQALEWVMDELIKDRFLDELRFAKAFARGKFRNNKWGKVKIKLEMKKKNLSEYCIRKGLEEISSEDYTLQLESLIHKKNEILKEEDQYKRRKKLASFAIRKGYEPQLVFQFVKKLD